MKHSEQGTQCMTLLTSHTSTRAEVVVAYSIQLSQQCFFQPNEHIWLELKQQLQLTYCYIIKAHIRK